MSERGATKLPVQVKSLNELKIRLIKEKKELYARFQVQETSRLWFQSFATRF